MKRIALIVMGCCFAMGMAAQDKTQQMADTIVKYQLKSGGWPKNQDWLKGVDPKEAKVWAKTGIGGTIDNGATVFELNTLAQAVDKVYEIESDGFGWVDKDVLKSQKQGYIEAFYLGLNYLLKMQYDNGGFPQYFPAKKGEDYSSQITFNDDAMVNVLKLLRDVANDAEAYRHMNVEKSMKKKCLAAYEKGLQCVLDCQIRVDDAGKVLAYGTEEWKTGKKTVWCQQHDKKTLVPVKARAYELPSYTGQGETVAILDLLMDVQNPSEAVKEAVKGGVEWLEAHAMKDVEVEHFWTDGGDDDIRLVERVGAPLLWARFYDLEKAEPMYCGRDGVPKKNLSDIDYERRNGYQWVGNAPQRVIDRYHQLMY